MKIAVFCQKGNSRSVALARRLKEMKHDAISAGMITARRETRIMLYEWADLIILLAAQYEKRIPERYKTKLVVWVTKDYTRPFDERLEKQLEKHLQDNSSVLLNKK